MKKRIHRGFINGTLIALLTIITPLGSLVLPQQTQADAGNWSVSWTYVTSGGVVVTDEEDRGSGCTDSSANVPGVSPDEVDIGSQADCQGPAPHYNPGNNGQPGATDDNTYSAAFAYQDQLGDSLGCSNIDDDWLYFRTRYVASPLENNATNGLKNAYWWNIISVSGGSIDFYVRLDGNGNKTAETLTVFPETNADNSPAGETPLATYTNPLDNGYVQAIDTGVNAIVGDSDEYFIDMQIPLSDLTGVCSNDQISYVNTSTSENSNEWNQKDYLLDGPSDPLPLSYDYDVTKTATDLNGGDLLVGEPVEYEITFTNSGEYISNLDLTDTLPAGATFDADAYGAGLGFEADYGGATYTLTTISDDPDNCTGCGAEYTGGTVYVEWDDFATGATLVVRFQVSFAATGQYENQAIVDTEEVDESIYSDDPAVDDGTDCDDSDFLNCEDQDTANDDPTIVVVIDDQEPDEDLDIAVTKDVSTSTPEVADEFDYTITVTNNGPLDATDLEIFDELPLGVTYVGDNGAGAYDPSTHIWLIGTLEAGNTYQLIITVSADPGTADEVIVNEACLYNVNETDRDDTNDCDDATVTVQPQTPVDPSADDLDLGVTHTVDNSTPSEGGTVTFTIIVTNNGPVAATGVTYDINWPAGITYLASSGVGTYNDATGIWTIGNLGVGNTATLTMTGRVNSGTASSTQTNLATLATVDQNDTNSANNTASASLVPTIGGTQATDDDSTTSSGAELAETGLGITLPFFFGFGLLVAVMWLWSVPTALKPAVAKSASKRAHNK